MLYLTESELYDAVVYMTKGCTYIDVFNLDSAHSVKFSTASCIISCSFWQWFIRWFSAVIDGMLEPIKESALIPPVILVLY